MYISKKKFLCWFLFFPVSLSRCPCCQLVFGGVNSLNAVKNHMHTAHSEVFHKCPSCPMAFKSASSADTHCSTQHPQLSEKAKQSKWVSIWKAVADIESYQLSSQEITLVFFILLNREIYKCVMCRTVFTQKALLNVHFDTHLSTQKVNVFKCPDCHKLFTQRTSLLEHVKVWLLFSNRQSYPPNLDWVFNWPAVQNLLLLILTHSNQ